MKGATYGDNPQSSQTMGIQRDLRATWRKIVERQLHGSPTRVGSESLTIGLPWAVKIGCAQVKGVFLAIAKNIQLNPAPCACIDRSSVLPEVERDLNEAAVVIESDISLQTNGRAGIDHLPGHRRPGDAAHHRVSKKTPFGSNRRSGRLRRQIIDDLGARGGSLAHRLAIDKNSCERSKKCAALRGHGDRINPNVAQGKLYWIIDRCKDPMGKRECR